MRQRGSVCTPLNFFSVEFSERCSHWSLALKFWKAHLVSSWICLSSFSKAFGGETFRGSGCSSPENISLIGKWSSERFYKDLFLLQASGYGLRVGIFKKGGKGYIMTLSEIITHLATFSFVTYNVRATQIRKLFLGKMFSTAWTSNLISSPIPLMNDSAALLTRSTSNFLSLIV